jgi:hypothetical protein
LNKQRKVTRPRCGNRTLLFSRAQRNLLSLDNLERIAEAFEVPIAELLNPDFNLRIEQPTVE